MDRPASSALRAAVAADVVAHAGSPANGESLAHAEPAQGAAIRAWRVQHEFSFGKYFRGAHFFPVRWRTHLPVIRGLRVWHGSCSGCPWLATCRLTKESDL